MNKLRTALLAIGLVLAPAAAMAQATPAAPAPVAAAPAPVAAAPAPKADAVAATPAAEQAKPEAPAELKPVPGIGQPVSGRIGIQPQVTENGERAQWFHDALLLPIITVISLFVLGLLLWVMVRYRRAANPVASKTSHNTLIEVIWTLVPVLILVVIAIPSISLLAAQYKPAGKDAVTIKVIGHQWYWSYQYPDHGDFEIVSNMLPDAEAAKRGEPRLLAVDNRIVIPVGTEIKAITKLAKTAERHYGCPQDIEWAVDLDLPEGDNIILLQSRPETFWSKKGPTTVVEPGTKSGDFMSSIVSTLMSPLYTKGPDGS